MRAQTDLENYRAAERLGTDHLAKPDANGFDFFTNQKWERFRESHSMDDIVHWPDGRQTKGLAPHIGYLKGFFVYAPDARIRERPIKVASGEETSLVEVIEGTVTKPMLTPDVKTIPPTGMTFELVINDIGHWKDGVMDEKSLFWDTCRSRVGLESHRESRNRASIRHQTPRCRRISSASPRSKRGVPL